VNKPFSPKFHGAWLGAVSGINLGSIIVGLIESYLTHKALPVPLIDLIDTVTGGLVAAFGAWLAPLLPGVSLTKDMLQQQPPAVVPPAK
jgi:hypothetical protein